MIDFSLSESSLNWQKAAKDFCTKYILPRDDLDRHGHFPMDLYQQAFDDGFITALIDRDLGGGGISTFDMLLSAEEFAYGDLGVATSAFLMKLSIGSLAHFGTPAQKEKWIRPLTQKLSFAAHAWTEPEGSSNLFGRAATTTAKPVPGGFLLNGVKSTISNATVASIYTVFARVEGEDSLGLTCFMVSRDAPGVSASNPYRKMGQRASDTGEVVFKDVFVPSEDQVGKNGQGAQINLRALRTSRVGVGAMSVGVARRARDLVKKFGHSRVAGDGKQLIQQQDFRFAIAEMEAEIEAMRTLVWRACWELEKGRDGVKFSSCAKLLAPNMAVRITGLAQEMLGAQGYLESGLVEKLARDAKILQIYEGTQAIQKAMIADTACRLGSLREP